MNRDELLKGLTAEQIEKARTCKNAEELLELAKKEGIELNDEQLEAVSGGCGTSSAEPPKSCPNCGSADIIAIFNDDLPNSKGGFECHCNACSNNWTVITC